MKNQPILCMPMSDIIDRITILKLKTERLPEDNTICELLGIYQTALDNILINKTEYFKKRVYEMILKLYNANKSIWNLESDIRQEILKDDKEVGRRSRQIRIYNKKRIQIKNEISKFFSQIHGIDIKIDHGSE